MFRLSIVWSLIFFPLERSFQSTQTEEMMNFILTMLWLGINLSLSTCYKIISKNIRTITLRSSSSSIHVKFGTKISSSKLSRSQNPSLISSPHSLRVAQKIYFGSFTSIDMNERILTCVKAQLWTDGSVNPTPVTSFFQIKLFGKRMLFKERFFSGI